MKKILLTGASGFLGSHLINHILTKTDMDIIMLDRLDLSGTLSRVHDLPCFEENKSRLKFVWHDLKSAINEFTAKDIGEVDYIVHMAASTHVDRAIADPMSFVMDNVVGSMNIIEFARKQKNLKLMLNFSTDEVFGVAEVGIYHKEGDPHHPTNIYAATKSAQEKLAQATFITHKLPVINTHTMNCFGPMQMVEKFIPKVIRSVMLGIPMPIYATVDSVSGEVKEVGSRVWIYAPHVAEAVMFLLENAKPGEEYNIIGKDEFDIVTVAEKIAKIIGKPLIPEWTGFYGARPGHDRRYALNGDKMLSMGWKPSSDFDTALETTVKWYIENPKWLSL